MNNNKIAFVILGLGIGGAEKFLVNVVNQFFRKGYTPLVILLSNDKTLLGELDRGVKVVTVLKKSRLDIFITNRIREHIDSEGITKIFCVNAYAFFLTKLAYLFNNKTQFFVSLHSTIPFTVKSYWQNLVYFRFISKKDLIIYLCNNQKKYLEKKYYLNRTGDKIVFNGIDTNYFDPKIFENIDKSALRKHFNLTETDKVIVQVARLQAEKRHTDAIDALFYLHNEYGSKAHLLLVGSGEEGYTNSLKQYVKDKGLDSYIHFAGSQSDVRKYYCLSDAFTLTSNSETFSLSALEAMAFCLPCSLTDIGGASEMTIDGVTGVLSNPEDAASIATSWHKLLSNNIKGEHIRQFVLEKFTSEKMLNQYLELVG